MLYHTMLYHTILYYTIPCYTIHTKLYYTILCHTIPYHTIIYQTILYNTIPYYTKLYHTIQTVSAELTVVHVCVYVMAHCRMSFRFNTHLFAIFGEKDCCESSFNILRVYSTADAVTPCTLWPKLLTNRVSIVKPGKNKKIKYHNHKNHSVTAKKNQKTLNHDSFITQIIC